MKTHEVVRDAGRSQDCQIGVIEQSCLETGKSSVEVQSHESLSERGGRSRTVDYKEIERQSRRHEVQE